MLRLSKRDAISSDKTNSEKKLLILNTLGDPYCMTILEIVQEMAKSAVEINAETRIPISTVYRRVQILHDINLLQVTGSISSDGKKYFLYKSKVKSIEAKYDGKLEVEIKLD